MHYHRSQRTEKLPTLVSKSAKSAKPPGPADEPKASGCAGRLGA